MTILKSTENNIMIASRIVKRGGLAIYPTETVYGLGCNPFNIEAVKRILEVKGIRKKPLPVLAANIEEAARIAFISQNGKRLAAKFWPGPVTLVFSKKTVLPDIVTFGVDSVGLRIPDSDVALRLIGLSGGLLIGTSANRSGEDPPRTVQEIPDELKEKVDVILDGGATAHKRPSTVADLTSSEPRILREGPISLEQILDTLAFGG
jgi:L-threonylcarbamoyladenylate synthase